MTGSHSPPRTEPYNVSARATAPPKRISHEDTASDSDCSRREAARTRPSQASPLSKVPLHSLVEQIAHELPRQAVQVGQDRYVQPPSLVARAVHPFLAVLQGPASTHPRTGRAPTESRHLGTLLCHILVSTLHVTPSLPRNQRGHNQVSMQEAATHHVRSSDARTPRGLTKPEGSRVTTPRPENHCARALPLVHDLYTR